MIKEMIIHKFIKNNIDLVREMANCQHESPYHLEGDVWTHTLMVLASLPEDACVELIWAALLHDTGKPIAKTKQPDGRYTFKNHEGFSTQIAVDVLTEEPSLTEKQKTTIVSLVNHHTLIHDMSVKKFTSRAKADYHYMGLLLDLNKADQEGRISSVEQTVANTNEQLRTVLNSLPPTEPKALGVTLKDFKDEAKVTEYLIGLPGSGKTRVANHHPWMTSLSYDRVVIEVATAMGLGYRSMWGGPLAKQRYQSFIDMHGEAGADHDLIVDQTNLTRKGRNKLKARLTTKKRPLVAYHMFLETTDICKGRIKWRESMRGADSKKISDATFNKMVSRIAVPFKDECHMIQMLWGVK